MGRPPEYDRDEVLASAKNLFWERGYEATSVEDLVASTGLGRSSLYQAFGSKRDLYQAVLDRYATENVGWLIQAMEDAGPGLSAIERLVEVFEETVADADRDVAHGCLMLCAIQELGRRDDGVADHGERYRDGLNAAFRRHLAEAAERGEVDPDGVEDRARLLVVLFMGLNAYLRGNRDRDAMRAAVAAIRAEVVGWRTATTV